MNLVVFDSLMSLMALLACAAAYHPRVHTGVPGAVGLLACAVAGLIATDDRIGGEVPMLMHALTMLALGVCVLCGWLLYDAHKHKGHA